jgi:hypothetical protein
MLVFTVIAAWLSTFNGYVGGEHVRNSIMLMIVLAAAFSAIYRQDRRRAFWIGFFAILLLSSLRNTIMGHFYYLSEFNVPNEIIRAIAGSTIDMRNPAFGAVCDTIRAAFCLTLATLSGMLAVQVYNRSRLEK